MNPEKHGINMRLLDIADLREFHTAREREREREFYQRYYNIIPLIL